MYTKHFGLRELPFTLTPNTEFFFNLRYHQEALNVLLVALRGGEGFIKIVGEVGTGKTLLCRKTLNLLGEDFVTAYVPNPCLTPIGLQLAVAEELRVDFNQHMRPKKIVGRVRSALAKGLGVVSEDTVDPHRLLKAIAQRLIELHQQGKKVVLLDDEAQALPEESLEAVRLLTNLETERSKLLQVVLFGQPELDQRISQPSLRQLKQRISFSYRLRPMSRANLEGYITHRLRVAGYNGPPPFTPSAISALHRASGGVPRLVNILTHKSLMAAFGRGESQIRRRHVRSASSDTEGARRWRLLSWPSRFTHGAL